MTSFTDSQCHNKIIEAKKKYNMYYLTSPTPPLSVETSSYLPHDNVEVDHPLPALDGHLASDLNSVLCSVDLHR